MTKSTITRERLEKIKSWRETYGAGSNVMLPAEEAEELARIALAAIDSEPVAFINGAWTLVYYRPPKESELKIGDKLYRHAQQPVVPDKMSYQDGVLFVLNNDMSSIERGTVAMRAWNACRAAMLQAGNSPVIPGGYVMVPKEPTKEMIDAGWLHFMGTKNPSSKGTYKAMLAAAEQEVPDGK
ncbi:hypothetical protein [Klebsiella grimontii]|uniref:hypothetical protein n=1 Tax=Klebsiella grimontii TaxID=2058152 RepID=UPI0012B882A5|nr:hypothetical protein [Klebsiella grimontii]QLN45630.1 hypothetical protein HV046_16665 [Klebsiella grimontii]